MVDHDKALRNEDYFDQYRKKQQDLRSLNTHLKELDQTISDKRNQISDLKRELEGMRKIITGMIEQDIDPTEARLRGTDDLVDDMWDSTMSNDAISAVYDQTILLNKIGIDPSSWDTIKLRDGY